MAGAKKDCGLSNGFLKFSILYQLQQNEPQNNKNSKRSCFPDIVLANPIISLIWVYRAATRLKYLRDVSTPSWRHTHMSDDRPLYQQMTTPRNQSWLHLPQSDPWASCQLESEFDPPRSHVSFLSNWVYRLVSSNN